MSRAPPSVIGEGALGDNATVDANLTLDPVVSDLDNRPIGASAGCGAYSPSGSARVSTKAKCVIGLGIAAARHLLPKWRCIATGGLALQIPQHFKPRRSLSLPVNAPVSAPRSAEAAVRSSRCSGCGSPSRLS